MLDAFRPPGFSCCDPEMSASTSGMSQDGCPTTWIHCTCLLVCMLRTATHHLVHIHLHTYFHGTGGEGKFYCTSHYLAYTPSIEWQYQRYMQQCAFLALALRGWLYPSSRSNLRSEWASRFDLVYHLYSLYGSYLWPQPSIGASAGLWRLGYSRTPKS